MTFPLTISNTKKHRLFLSKLLFWWRFEIFWYLLHFGPDQLGIYKIRWKITKFFFHFRHSSSTLKIWRPKKLETRKKWSKIKKYLKKSKKSHHLKFLYFGPRQWKKDMEKSLENHENILFFPSQKYQKLET